MFPTFEPDSLKVRTKVFFKKQVYLSAPNVFAVLQKRRKQLVDDRIRMVVFKHYIFFLFDDFPLTTLLGLHRLYEHFIYVLYLSGVVFVYRCFIYIYFTILISHFFIVTK
jgi:hypothetical protein